MLGCVEWEGEGRIPVDGTLEFDEEDGRKDNDANRVQ